MKIENCAACAWVKKHGTTKLGTGHIGHTCGTFESVLQRSLRKDRLSSRARGVLQYIVSAEHERMRKHPILAISLTDTELLRRAAKVEPPLSYDRLRTRFARCGAVTAREVCVALGLPVQPPKLTYKVQCPRCGHVFGGKS